MDQVWPRYVWLATKIEKNNAHPRATVQGLFEYGGLPPADAAELQPDFVADPGLGRVVTRPRSVP